LRQRRDAGIQHPSGCSEVEQRPGERLGLFSIEDHAHSDRRTLADFRGVIWREDWGLPSPVPKSEGPFDKLRAGCVGTLVVVWKGLRDRVVGNVYGLA